MTCGDNRLMMEQGAPIGWFMPEDALTFSFVYLLVPKHAEHSNAGKLLVAFLMTPEGQKVTWDVWRRDLHLFPESRLAEALKDLMSVDKKKTIQSIEWAEAHPEKEKTFAEVVDIFIGKHGGGGRPAR
jgi:ABC-type Fe3+ transport system substrate-binding protein